MAIEEAVLDIDLALRFILFGLQCSLNVEFNPSEVERLFAEAEGHCYTLWRSAALTVTGRIEDYEPGTVWLRVESRKPLALSLAAIVERAKYQVYHIHKSQERDGIKEQELNMSENLRFTGDWPPLKYLNQYANWTNALDEEDDEDQDETTLKPSEEQSYIDNETVFTVADALLADGRKCIAIVQVDFGDPQVVDVFETDVPWRLSFSLPDQKWVPFVQKWLPAEQQMPSVSPDDICVFPLRVISRLPLTLGGTALELQIEANSVLLKP